MEERQRNCEPGLNNDSLLVSTHILPSTAPPSSPRTTPRATAELPAAAPQPVPRQLPQQRVAVPPARYYSVRTIGSESLHDANSTQTEPPLSMAPQTIGPPTVQHLYQMRGRYAPNPVHLRGQAPQLEHLFTQRWYDQRAPPSMAAFRARPIGQRRGQAILLGRGLDESRISTRIEPTRSAPASHRAAPQFGVGGQPPDAVQDLLPKTAPPQIPPLELAPHRIVAALIPPAYRAPPTLASSGSTGEASRQNLNRPSSAPVVRQRKPQPRVNYGAASTKVRPAIAQLQRPASAQHQLRSSTSSSMLVSAGPTQGGVVLKLADEPYLAVLREKTKSKQPSRISISTSPAPYVSGAGHEGASREPTD